MIQTEIQKLHKRNKGDWKGLSKQVIKNYVPLKYNIPQMVAAKASLHYKWMFLEWGRGTGKTTILSYLIGQVVRSMPRSNGLFIGPTYQKILTQILPSFILGMERMGYYQNLHYFIGRRPPKSWKWPMPYQPPQKFDKYIIFYNGTGINLISHDVPGDGRGLNTDFEFGDESALLDVNKLNENTLPTLRGSNKKAFKKSPFFRSRVHVSSTPLTPKGRWFTDMQEAGDLKPKKIKFISADCRFNMHNLGKGYLEDAREVTIPWIYNAEYLNVRPKQVKDGFYPLLDEDIHTYNRFNYDHYVTIGQSQDCRGDADLVKSKPLIVGVDWGAAINCLVVNQHIGRELRALKSMYVLGDDKKVQSDLFDDFHNYYRYHKTKDIFLWYDNSGNNETGITKLTRAQQVQKQLTTLGWKVRLMTVGGRNPEHEKKHVLWNLMFKEDNSQLPAFRMNRSNCRELWVSMSNAQTKQGRNGEVKKDKSGENRGSSIERQFATDLSDAEDAVIFGMFKHKLHSFGGYLPGITISNL